MMSKKDKPNCEDTKIIDNAIGKNSSTCQQQKATCNCCHSSDSLNGGKISCVDTPTAFSRETDEQSLQFSRSVYHISNMDCPMEEALIRKKLSGLDGVRGLEFNLVQRTLVVNHNLPTTKDIQAALKSIGMLAEPIKSEDSKVAVFSVTGMDCPMEENLIRSKLEPMPGVLNLDFNLMNRILKITHAPSALPEISQALASLDLGARLLDEQNSAEPVTDTTDWKKLVIAGIFAVLSECFDFAQGGNISIPGANSLFAGIAFMEWLAGICAIIAIVLSGLDTYKKGWIAVSNFNLNMNALMSVAVTGAVLIGQFPEAAMVMVLFNVSEAIEAKALDRARNAIKGLMALAPEKADVLQKDGSWREMDIREVAIGSLVRVGPGEKIGLDGIVKNGQSQVNQAPITGESMPVDKGLGDTVYAGTINESGSFEFEVTSVATDSTLARIIHAVEEAQGSRAPIQRFVDIFARYYTPLVFLAAILTAVIPPLVLGAAWAGSIYTALVILVIGCPCALVISTPVTIVSGMSAATKHGILIKGGLYLEQGRLLNCVALDKTGTLTFGKPVLTDFIYTGTLPEAEVKSALASLTTRSDHPVSKAIAQAETGTPVMDVSDFAALPGQGIKGVINGQIWYLGNLRMLASLKADTPKLEKEILSLENQGKTVVALVGRGKAQCLAAVADTMRPGSRIAMQELKKYGVKTVMLTGDNANTARAIASQADVAEFRANLLPEDKLRIIEDLKKEGFKVGMVGDGINDAPALATANIGFAMAAGGTDTAIETADVALMDDDLRKIPRFISLSRSTYAILVQNITLALSIKAVFFVLTFAGVATMWMAVFADVGTALMVVANGLRVMRK